MLLAAACSSVCRDVKQVLDGKIDMKKDGKPWWNQETIHLIFQEVAEKRITQIEASKKVGSPKSTFHEQFHLWLKRTNYNP